MAELAKSPTIPLSLNFNGKPSKELSEVNKQLNDYIKRWDEVYRYLGADLANVFANYVRRDGTLPLTGDWDAGNFNISAGGYITGKKSGVFVYALDQDTIIAVADTWTVTGGTKTIPVIEDFSAAITYTPGVKFDGTLTQFFKIDWAVAYSIDSPRSTIHFSVFKNGVIIPGSEMQTYGANINQAYNLSGHAVVELTAGDEIQLLVESDTTGTLTLLHETTTINQFFN